MAQLKLSRKEAADLANIVMQWRDRVSEMDSTDATEVCLDVSMALWEKITDLSFATRACVVCGTEFEAANPRKQTCSDACRQTLSRSKRDPMPDRASSHKATVTELPTRPKVLPQIQGTLPECVDQSVPIPPAPKGPRNRKVWHPLRVVLRLKADGTHDVADVKNWDNESLRPDNRNRPQPITEAALADGLPAFMAALGAGSGATAPHCWCFHFAMHIDGTPWIDELKVPQVVITTAQATVTGKS